MQVDAGYIKATIDHQLRQTNSVNELNHEETVKVQERIGRKNRLRSCRSISESDLSNHSYSCRRRRISFCISNSDDDNDIEDDPILKLEPFHDSEVFIDQSHHKLPERIESKSKNRFSTLTTTTVESTFTNKLHLSLSTICKDDVISNHDDVIANINHCYSSEIDLGQGQDAESVFL